jgi:O-antigen ligase
MRALVEGGLLGFVSFVLLIGSLLRASWRAASGRGDLPLAFLGISIAYAIISAGSNSMGKGAFQFYFWLLAGVSYVWAAVVPASPQPGEVRTEARALQVS